MWVNCDLDVLNSTIIITQMCIHHKPRTFIPKQEGISGQHRVLAPTLTPPLYSAAIAPSLVSRSCITKPEHGYPKCTLVPPRRFHQCQPQSLPNPPHELDLECTSGAWRHELPSGHLTCWAVTLTGTQQCLPSRASRNAQ